MGKHSRKPAEKGTPKKEKKEGKEEKSSSKPIVKVDKKAIDSSIDSLFASSLGPVQPPPKSRYQDLPKKKKEDELSESEEDEAEEEDDEVLSSIASDEADEAMEDADEEEELDESAEQDESASESDGEAVVARVRELVEEDKPNKKRKRGGKEEEVEDAYMRKLVQEEIREEEERKKKQKIEPAAADSDDEEDADAAEKSDDSDAESFTIPQHETQAGTADDAQELEKAARTVFLGNVSSEAITSKSAKKTLLRHLASFIDDLADNNPPHKVESLRFRSTAFSNTVPKRAAFAKKEVLDATTKSTNAYAVYSTKIAAVEAAKRLNGTMVLNRHLRVDSLAHPAKTDHKRCVFVGNLGFVDDESKTASAEGEKKKTKPPGDVEEGLWVQFSKAGKVESVRVVRDPKTRVGKGFAYVQFEDENGVEAALQFNDQKYPPLLPRKLRVVRAKAPKKKKTAVRSEGPSKAKGVYNAKVTEEQRTNQGRAKAMLGKAGQSFVFEGHRASSKQGTSGLKLGGKRKGKPSNRSSKRAAAWQKAGGKTQFKK